MLDQVVSEAHRALNDRLRQAADVATHTRDAQRIARVWRAGVVALDPLRYKHEVSVDPVFDQRLDILDTTTKTAYEFKVSGKNAHNEFYKDVVKVLLWNDRKPHDTLTRLVFITDGEHGRAHLGTPMIGAYIQYLQRVGLSVQIEYVGQF